MTSPQPLNRASKTNLAWEELRRTMAGFAAQERQALKQHKSVRDIHKARKTYMTNILKGSHHEQHSQDKTA